MVAEYAGTIIPAWDLVGEDLPMHVRVDSDARSVLVWTEYVDFHVHVRGLTNLVDALDGRPTERACDALHGVLDGELNRSLIYVYYVDIASGDEPAFEIEVELNTDPTDDLTALAEDAWAVASTLINVTDPGTFGHIYALAEASRRLED